MNVILPAARSGILAAVILGVGRALGETMAVTFVIGNAHPALAGVADEVRGDVYYQQKNMAAARVAWHQALKALPPTNAGKLTTL